MTEVTRFPHYDQAENVVTNHVMVMLRMLYNSSPKLLDRLLFALCAAEVTIGPRFSQQVAGSHSVPDGLIQQEPMAIFVETKLGSYLDANQLKRHCQTIDDRLPNRTGSFLIALASGGPELGVPAGGGWQPSDTADWGVESATHRSAPVVDRGADCLIHQH